MFPAGFDEALILRGAVVAGFSDDDYFALCQSNELLHIERTPARELVIKPLPGFAVSAQVGSALFQLHSWSHRYGGHTLGWAGYTLPDGAVLGPGVSWGQRGGLPRYQLGATAAVSAPVSAVCARNQSAS